MLWRRRDRSPRPGDRRRGRFRIEQLEQRTLLSVVPPGIATSAIVANYDHEAARNFVHPIAVHGHSMSGAEPDASAVTPNQIKTAYAFNQLSQNGSGQTIAIVDAYDDPNILADLQHFDAAFGISDPPIFTKLAQDGSTNYPGLPPAGSNWDLEMSLDVEWAHALAPAANIALVEASSDSFADLFSAVNTARDWSGVSVVSMSWGGSEYSGETAYDSTLTTPAGHSNVVFVASAGDRGSPGVFPAYSPNVVAVGGTTLSTDSAGDDLGETTWNDANGATGGGISTVESQPAYQVGTVNSSQRAMPDVSFASDESLSGKTTGVWVDDSADYGSAPWVPVVGTSFSAPAWAAFTALANQARSQKGFGPLDGPSQMLPAIYNIQGSSAFHDVTTGSNGTYSASPGFDLVSGRGTPAANAALPGFVPYLAPNSDQTLIGAQAAVDASGGLAQQNLFVVGSDGRVREDQYNQPNHAATGQIVVDRTTSFAPGTKLTVYRAGPATNLFAIGQDGHLKWDQYVNGAWSGFSIVGADTSVPQGSTLVGYSIPGVISLFAVGSDGFVKQFQYVASQGGWLVNQFNNMLSFSPGAPLSIYESGGFVNLFAVDANGNVGQEQFANGSWDWGTINASLDNFAAATPLAIYESGGLINLFGVNRNGDVGQVQFTGSAWVTGVISAATAHLAPGTPLAIYEAGSVIDLFGANTDGQIGQVQYANGSWQAWAIPSGGISFAAGSQVSVHTDPSGVQEVFGIGSNGDLLDEEFYTAWNEYDLR